MVEVTRRARRLSTSSPLLLFVAQVLHCCCRFRQRCAGFMLLAIPALNSFPSAPVSVYLDFDGHVQQEWGTYANIVTPPFDQDGKPDEFSVNELAAIREIWARVAEDYAPFNVNVTTVHPRDFANGRAVHVVVGGHYADWYGIRVGGVSFANSFVNSMPNVVFVFSKALAGGSPKYVADLISHEVGHTFGLEEQSVYNESGARVRDYNSGDSNLWGPLMGNSLAAQRSIWHYGTSTSLRKVQDDVAVIARPENGFGLRRDDFADEIENSHPLSSDGLRFQSSGIIGNVRDADCFQFQFPGGRVRLRVDVAEYGPNLNSKLELRALDGRLLAKDDGEQTLESELELDLTPGSYCAVVRSYGSYGDLGRYEFSGEFLGESAPLSHVAMAAADSARTDDVVAESTGSNDQVVAPVRRKSATGDASLPVAGPATR